MAEEKMEWRDAWKKLIDASRTMILNGDKDDTTAFDNLTTLQNDKMLLFEKAIAYESLGNKEKARELYKIASTEGIGLPVEHWRKRAGYFLTRFDRGGFMTTDLASNQPLFNAQWDIYFNIHYYANLDNYIRYLAISSVSRIGSEPAMAIVIFRTCLEIGLWTYFEKEANEINEKHKEDYKRRNPKKTPKDISLNDLLDSMNESPYELFEKNEFVVFDKTRKDGNVAAHPGTLNEKRMPFHYEEDELIAILNNFNQTMRYLNDHAKEKRR